MCEQMKGNKDMIKALYKSQGMEFSDEQLEGMMNMMNPDTIRQATEMMEKDPSLAQ